MAVRRVFIAWSHSLFHGSVRLLLNHPEIEVIGACLGSEIIWSEVISLHPDTIIIERGGEGGENAVGLEAFPACESGMRFVQVGLEDNTAWVCRCEPHVIEQAQDLVLLVLNA